MTERPLVLASDPVTARAVAEDVERRGWHRVDGLELPSDVWEISSRRLLCCFEVRDADDAAAVLVAVARGAAVVVSVDRAERTVLERLSEDLTRFGRVEHASTRVDPLAELSADERELLLLLAEGRTIGDAVGALHLSRRTLDRRLARVRAALAVSTTREAVLLAHRSAPRRRTRDCDVAEKG